MIQLFKVFMSDKVRGPVLSTLYSGYIGQGPRVREFEDALAERFLNPHVLALSAGTHGLHLSLILSGVGPGDEVITSPLTCTATNWPILMQGAKPVWADIKDDLNIDPQDVKKKVTAKTKAIIAVHWGGYPCDLQELQSIVLKNGLMLIEDAAHAYGSEYRNGPVGACVHSNFTMMSFQAIKHLTCVDGGVLFCMNRKDYNRGKLLRWYGIDREGPREDFRCEHPIMEVGYKYHMNDVAAAIGLANMPEVEDNIRHTVENAEFYNQELSNVPGVRITQVSDDRKSSYWLYTILVQNRSEFCNMMTRKGIAVSRVHERNDIHPCTMQFKQDLPNLEQIMQEQICIPVGWWVSRRDSEYIVNCIKEGW